MATLTPNTIDLPKFADQDVIDGLTGQNNVVPAIVADQDFGWHPSRRRPERNVMNWLHRQTYLQVKHMKEVFQPEVEACLVNNDIFIQPGFHKQGLQVQISNFSSVFHPSTATVEPGRCALSEIGSIDLADLLVFDVPSQLLCNVTSEWVSSASPGIADFHNIVPGSPESIHLFLVGKDPSLSSPQPVTLVFDFSSIGDDILSNTAIAAAGYTHFRRMFSFIVKANTSSGNAPYLPFAKIYKDRISWADHEENQLDTMGPILVGTNSTGWVKSDNTEGSNAFPVPAQVPILLQMHCFAHPTSSVAGNKARVRGFRINSNWAENTPTDLDNASGDSVPIRFQEMDHITTDIYTDDAGEAMFQFRNFSIPLLATGWLGIYILGYEHVDTLFPVPLSLP